MRIRARRVVAFFSILATAGFTLVTAGAPAAGAADLTLGAGTYAIDTTALTITGPGTSLSGANEGGVAVFRFGNVTVPAGATVNAVGTRPLKIVATGAIAIGGTLDASGASATDFGAGPYAGGPGGGAGGTGGATLDPGKGPGGGEVASNTNNGGGGGGFGGRGARGGVKIGDAGTAGAGGPKYGNLATTFQGGSGGASGSIPSGTGGGGGAGAVALFGSSVTVGAGGTVRADGGGGAAGSHGASAGGSGGAIVLHAGKVKVDGALSAAGGPGGAGGCCGDAGGGGGGRIALRFGSLTMSGTISVAGGASGARSTTIVTHGGLSPDVAGAAGIITFTQLVPAKLTAGPAKTIGYGSSVTIATRLSDGVTGKAIAGAPVLLYKRTSTSDWKKVTTRTTSSTGGASASVAPKEFTQFQWRFDGDGRHKAAAASQSISVAQVVSIKSTTALASLGSTFKLFGTVAPNGNGSNVVLRKLSGTTWTKVATATLKSQKLPDGRTVVGYVFKVTASPGGSQTYRVDKAATATLTKGVSPPIVVVVL
jgi:hypothetical protein